MKPQGYSEIIRTTLLNSMRADDRIVLISAGRPSEFGPGLAREFGAERVRNTPLDSATLVAAALGAAQTGLHPLIEIHSAEVFSNFASMIEQTPLPANAPSIVFWLRAPMDNHCWEDAGWMAQTRSAIVGVPADGPALVGFLAAALQSRGKPVILIEHPSIKEEVPLGSTESAIFGSASVRRAGENLTLLACGHLVRAALDAAERAHREGLSIEVLDLGTLRPLDYDTVLRSLSKTGRLLVAAPKFAQGIVGEILLTVNERGFDDLDAPMRHVASDVDAEGLLAAISALAGE
jgi:pyruvate/2-oxoglutarate/acetoin dehydrogenase E1 component